MNKLQLSFQEQAVSTKTDCLQWIRCQIDFLFEHMIEYIILFSKENLMNRRESIELTVLCLIHKGDTLLLQNRVKADWKGYALPGGHVEPGESIVDAVIREMREETGLTIHHPKLCGVKQFPIDAGRYLVLLFETEDFEGQLHSSAEGEMNWIPRSALAGYDTVEDLEELLEVMLNPALTEFQYTLENGNWLVNLR